MTGKREILHVAIVTSNETEAALRFHNKVAAAPDSHLWARSESQIKSLIKDRCLFGVWRGDERQLVALCYATLDHEKPIWEVGGLAVDDSVKQRGIGTILVRFAIAHTIVYQEPWKYGQTIIAHVHEANNDPRGILKKLGFKFADTITVPDSANPPKWMKRNAEGKIVGDLFEFPPNSIDTLCEWFSKELPELMVKTKITFGFGPFFDLDMFRRDLCDAN